jgi:hypothetical protein
MGDDHIDIKRFTKRFLAEMAVPIPASILLLGTGFFAIIGIRR